MGWIMEPKRLGRRCQNRKQARCGKCCGAITTKLRGAGHLSANAADIAERLVEFVHDRFTLQCKVYRMGKLVNMPLMKFPSSRHHVHLLGNVADHLLVP